MTAQQQFFPFRGGLDQETPSIAMPPGKVIACLNHEAVPLGYARTEGYERFNGRPAPSDAIFYRIGFTNGLTAFAAGDIITGVDSGATARVLAEAEVSGGSFETSDAIGELPLHLVDGFFDIGETLMIEGEPRAIVSVTPVEVDARDGDAEADLADAAKDYARSLIEAVPGVGPVRGVLWFGDKLHAWRDNAGLTAGGVHHSSDDGWAEVDLGSLAPFISGGPYEIVAGDVITGHNSGATATVRLVAVDANTEFSSGDAAGTLVLDNISGTFQANEEIGVGTNTLVATITAIPEEAAFPVGGRYEFDIFNFYATASFERAYGANGVSKAFEFDGSSVVFITTGMEEAGRTDTPFLVKEHKNHLFLGFEAGSLQHSQLGEPRSFNARLGAAELGMGHEITNIIPNANATLLITTAKSLKVLTGNDSSDWTLEPLSDDAGAKPFTAQRIGDIVYLDNRGVRSVGTTQAYGNFRLGTFTSLINRELKNKRLSGAEPVASCVLKSKDLYLLFFSDGSGISVFFGTKKPEAMLFEYPFVVSSLHVAEVNGSERLFVGAEDGFVYEINRGTSFDGEEIEAYLAFPYHHQGSPRTFKRYQKIELEVRGSIGTQVGLLAQFDYGGGAQPNPHSDTVDLSSGGALWGLAIWADFTWSSPLVAKAETYVQGAGFNMSVILLSRSKRDSSYTVEGMTVVFSPRGNKR